VNAQTVNLVDRPYAEIVDDILTAIVGGVVNEPIVFDVKEDHYPLSQPANDVRSVKGTITVPVNGQPTPVHQTFQSGVDYLFSLGDNAVVWQPGGHLPDDETIFYVDYFPPNTLSPLSDINVGSVTRTLSEAIGREIATVYQQINQAYLAGFVDTATGQSLDLVVSILGVVRETKEYATGLVTFFRDPSASDGNISVPEGTLLSTAKGEATFLTSEMRTLQRGQVRIDVPLRASDASKGPSGVVPANAITKLAQPITGISRATNFDPTVLGANDESDDELRARAKAVLQSLGKGTLAALARVVFEERAKLDEVWDPNSSPLKRSDPGSVTLLVETEPERFVSLEGAVQETRAAGVLATVVARYVFFKPRLVVTIAKGLTAEGKVKVVNQIIDAIQQYVDGIGAGDSVKAQDMQGAIVKNVKEVGDPKKVQFADAITWRSDVAQPGAAPLVDALIDAIGAAPAGDTNALRTSLTAVLTNESPLAPTERRIPDRSLVQGAGGQRATDSEIAAAQFQVISVVQGDKWSIALDLEPADIVLAEQ